MQAHPFIFAPIEQSSREFSDIPRLLASAVAIISRSKTLWGGCLFALVTMSAFCTGSLYAQEKSLPELTISSKPIPTESWSFHFGILEIPEYSGVHPLLQPQYETTLSKLVPLTMLFDVTLAYTDFSQLDILSSHRLAFVDYGFHGGVRYTFAKDRNAYPFTALEYFTSLLFGADVFPDPPPNDPGRVCIAFPLTFGALYGLGERSNFQPTTQLEFGLTARPVWYYRQSWGFSYAATIGIRFPSY
jgi:hypothetical protein